MNNDMQSLLRQVLRDHRGADAIFDRLANEYRAKGEDGKHELFLAVVAELATAQAAVSALAQRSQSFPR